MVKVRSRENPTGERGVRGKSWNFRRSKEYEPCVKLYRESESMFSSCPNRVSCRSASVDSLDKNDI